MAWIKRLFLLGCVAAGLCLLYGFLIEPRQLKIRTLDFPIAGYDGPPLTMVAVSDIHIGGWHVPPTRVAELVETINAESPDMIFMAGDFVNGHKARVEWDDAFNLNIDTGLAHLSGLKAPKGVFAALGNHDAWYEKDFVRTGLESAGVTVLDNQAMDMGTFCIVGLADADTDTPSRSAYQTCAEGQIPLVVTHSPDAHIAFRTDTALAIAGHTHGGQINLPLLGRRVNASRVSGEHSYGLSELSGVPIFVTSGVGTSILPARFRAPPEIVVITLR